MLLEIRNKLKNSEINSSPLKDTTKITATIVSQHNEDVKIDSPLIENTMDPVRHKEQNQKRKREGLVQEIIISVSNTYLFFIIRSKT